MSKTKTMAVVTLKYIKNRNQAKANLRYITHRKGENPREKITRTLFNEKGETVKQDFYRTIDSAKREAVIYKFMISPDPKREDTNKDLDLQHITRVTILKLEGQLGRRLVFVAAVHDDHTDKRHIHGLFLLGGKVPKREFLALAKTARLAATQEARLERKALDRVRTHPRYPRIAASIRFLRPVRESKSRGVRLPVSQPGCRNCGFGEITGIPGRRLYCPMCRTRLKNDREQGLELEVNT